MSIMHLSSEEASEITCLAYAVDGRLKAYDEACRRCPKILKPVPGLRTKRGRMFRDALVAGGMLPVGIVGDRRGLQGVPDCAKRFTAFRIRVADSREAPDSNDVSRESLWASWTGRSDEVTE